MFLVEKVGLCDDRHISHLRLWQYTRTFCNFQARFADSAVCTWAAEILVETTFIKETQMAAVDYIPVVQQLYVSYFGRPADYYGLKNFTEQLAAITPAAPTDFAELSAAAQAAPNSAVGKLVNSFNSSAESAALYGTDNSQIGVSKFVAAIYQNVLNREADVEGLTFWVDAILKGVLTRANAATAITAGALANETAQGLLDKATVENKVAVATSFTDAIDTTAEINGFSGDAAAATARGMLSTVDSTTIVSAFQATVTSTLAAIVTGSIPTTTTTLTDGVDTLTGTNGNDTFNGTDTTLTGLDSINGGAGSDTLNINDVAGATADLSAASISNVESIVLTSTTSLANAALDVSGMEGLTSLRVDLRGVAAAQTVTADATTAVNLSAKVTTASDLTVAGGSTVAVTANNTVDNSGKTITVNGAEGTSAVSVTQTGTAANASAVTINDDDNANDTVADSITTVTLSGLKGGVAQINSDALATLNLSNSAKNVTIDNDTADHALALNINGLTAGIISDVKAKTVNVASSSAASSGITVTADLATAINFSGDKSVSTALGATQAADLVITVTNTAGVTISTTLDADVTFTGGEGKDSVVVGATTEAITTGAGDDTVTVAGVAALGTDGSINAGEGTDTLTFSTFANAVTASASATFEGTVSGFEKLNLSGANAAAAAAVNLANLDDINYVTLSATNTETLTINNLASGGTIAFTADQTAGKDATVAITNAAVGTADVLNVVLSKATALAAVELIAADVETVNITSTETADPLVGTVSHALELNATAAKTLTITGNAGVTFGTLTGATALTSIDASGVTAGLVSFTTAALANAATIKGGNGGNTIVATAATKAVTFTGGEGVDNITIANAKNNVIDTGAGNDIIVVGNGNNTVTAGAGNDSITLGSGANTVDTGAGTNTVVFGTAMAGLNNITLGSGVDTLDFNVVSTAAGYYPSVTGIAAGDKIDLVGASAQTITNEATLGSKITLGQAASFANYLDAANAGDGATANGIVNWFQFNGNTYVVLDNSANATYADGVDLVIELIGTVDLSSSTLAAEVITIV